MNTWFLLLLHLALIATASLISIVIGTAVLYLRGIERHAKNI